MDEQFRQALSDIKLTFELFKQSINLFKSAKDLLPDSKEKEEAEKYLERAETSALIAEAKLAQNLGFQLCPKEWPPVVLVATKVTKNCDIYECPSCKTKYLNRSKRSGTVRLDEYHIDP